MNTAFVVIFVCELDRRGCTIPQPSTDKRANVIRGEFAKAGQKDWAVLCSTRGSTSLVVFWNGSAANSTDLAKIPDDPGRIFDWYIRPVDRKFILDHYRAYGGPKPALICSMQRRSDAATSRHCP